MERIAKVVFVGILFIVGVLFGNALRGRADRAIIDAGCAANAAIVGQR